MANHSKAELNELIAKAGLDKRNARKLHVANGTADESAPAPAEQQKRPGHGSAQPHQPDLGTF